MNVAATDAATRFTEDFTQFPPMLVRLTAKTYVLRRNLMPKHPPDDRQFLKLMAHLVRGSSTI
jgi:hypothetical protein